MRVLQITRIYEAHLRQIRISETAIILCQPERRFKTMEIYQRIAKDGRRVFRELTAQGIRFSITPANNLRIETPATKKQFELIRLWKAQIIENISPHCSNCTLAMRLIENGDLWFCPLGCESTLNKINE
jgi:urease beta subunit